MVIEFAFRDVDALQLAAREREMTEEPIILRIVQNRVRGCKMYTWSTPHRLGPRMERSTGVMGGQRLLRSSSLQVRVTTIFAVVVGRRRWEGQRSSYPLSTCPMQVFRRRP